MADSILYSNALVTFDGLLLAEEASVTINKRSGLNPVYTVAKGFAGMSQGAGTIELTIDMAVPSSDFEINPDKYMQTGKIVEIGLVMANRQTTVKMFVTDADYSHSVNQEARMSLKLIGPLQAWE